MTHAKINVEEMVRTASEAGRNLSKEEELILMQSYVKDFAERVRTGAAARVRLGVGSFYWVPEVQTKEGVYGFDSPFHEGWELETLLQTLAGEGITQITVDFAGIPNLFMDRAPSLSEPCNSIDDMRVQSFIDP